MWPDLINGTFELVGAGFTWRNAWQLKQERTIAGVYWPTILFFTVWGAWNLLYYPALDQWVSFFGGVLLVLGNAWWVLQAITLYIEREIADTDYHIDLLDPVSFEDHPRA